MMTYPFQGWSCRGPQKYRDMILDIATEEIGHAEMLATMIAWLLESSPVEAQEAMAKMSLVGAMMGGAHIEDKQGLFCAIRASRLGAISSGSQISSQGTTQFVLQLI
jgi:Mn-containing catalase